MANFKQKNFESKKGTTFLFQHPGVRMVSKINDQSKNKHGVLSEERMSELMLKHVIVQPKRTIDDFEDYSEYMEVVNKAYAFITGNDEEEQSDDNEEGSEGQGEA
ncbi:hypothetical protein [Paenibacillus xylanexedens]|uniref:hypothetical protein n=1 Tax=Paenibacillus xylanexedens TaxID=528191 RepID=UPI000F51D2C1|nr:hypothetical protein [Paenibacillus xylanexedens]RPK29869.1 hypothetical protein EDO6_00493 [Paenibacillus xylanexedens]